MNHGVVTGWGCWVSLFLNREIGGGFMICFSLCQPWSGSPYPCLRRVSKLLLVTMHPNLKLYIVVCPRVLSWALFI